MKLKPGEKKYFHYSGSDLKEYAAHDGKLCNVVRPLTADEHDEKEVGRMYKIEFADGFTGSAFEDELRDT